MKKSALFVLACLILGFSTTTHPRSAREDEAFLQGLWAQPCQQGGMSTEAFKGKMVLLSEMFFADKDCRQPIVIFMNEGQYELPAEGHMDFRFTSVRLRLMTEFAVNDFNTRRVCGDNDWQLAVEKEISGRLCEILFVGSPQRIPAVGDMRYGIYHLDKSAGRLAFGKLSKEKNASTPENRPTELNPRYYLKIQKQRAPHLRPNF